MTSEKDRQQAEIDERERFADGCAKVFSRLETDVAPDLDMRVFAASAAISLKRIADMMDAQPGNVDLIETLQRSGYVTNSSSYISAVVKLINENGFKIVRR